MKNVVEYLNYSQNYYEMDNEDKKEEIDNEDEKKYGYSLMRLGEIYNLLLQTGKTDDTISKNTTLCARQSKTPFLTIANNRQRS